MTKVLITGGSGQIGTRLTTFLEAKGHQVAWLSRSPDQCSQKCFYWNPDQDEIDDKSLLFADVIVHLAGIGIMDKRWSDSFKSKIITSRVKGLELLSTQLKKQSKKPICISAAGINYYGAYTKEQTQTEKSALGEGFIAEVCEKWEGAAFQLENQVQSLCILRIGLVLGKGMVGYEKMALPIKWGVGSRLGSGNQMMPWIHQQDLCAMINHAIENKLNGIYNAVSSCDSQIELTKKIAKHYSRPIFLPPVPGFVLKLLLGEGSSLVLNGYPTSNNKIKETGFEFKYLNPNA